MRYPVTSRTKSLVAELASLAEAADGRLARASADAQREWKALRYRWPTEDELGKGIVELSDDDLEVMRSKVMRFVSILGAAGPAVINRRDPQARPPGGAEPPTKSWSGVLSWTPEASLTRSEVAARGTLSDLTQT
jgi:hypothetical protein